ncbi:GTPase activating protein [Ophidiomyces ophidiicola]|nr:GTPase activating protein [Ophidiomyces ophidiicola]KAI2015958.1 GTPase activating protein [Ophidiomyces ophidiicola]KAI2057212.1 GTPase activating protein [Ophidiomyces ophidiicola]KAI2080855.1 GTPase activating protein [Ophidiomyces ophidiicola]KAI2144255.1 GTPase activating protein [Ophidiomyces ophidiicola]
MAGRSTQFTPPPSPPSPSASFYDISDNEEGEYSTVTHTKTGRGVKLLFSKSKNTQVYVHPTPSSKDNIPGFIALIQQKSAPVEGENASAAASPLSAADASSYLLAWVPESSLGDAYTTYVKVDLAEGSSPPRQSYLVPPLPTTTAHTDSIGLYAFAVPLSQIYSLLVRPPSLGWWFGSLVINTKAGDSSAALFFHDSECESTILQKKKRTKESFNPFEDGHMFWGGDEVLRWLKRYVEVYRSGADPNVYLINPSEEDKTSFGHLPKVDKAVKTPSNAGVTTQPQREAEMEPITKALKETRWKVLEQLSKITTFTRRTAQDLADHPKLPPQVRRLMINPEVQTLQDEFDSARIYLARWAMGISEQSDRERNQRIWTAKDVLAMEDTSVGEFEILNMEAANMTISDKRKIVSKEEWKSWFDSTTGRLQITVNEAKERIFHGGLDANDGVRKEAWLFLLGVYSWDSSRDERNAVMNSKRDEYVRLKGGWWERMVEGASTSEDYEWWKEQKNRIEKDVHRTDRTIPLFAGEDIPHPDPDSPFAETGTNVHLEQMKDMLLTYNEYNRDLGYVQGMSDLLAPIYAVMQDDAVAFWAFVGFMDRMERNFLRDQSGMREQLLTLDQLVQLMDPELYLHLQKAESTNFFFFFRMFLVWFKREFEWVDILRLWEALWTDFLSSSFHIFIALAILEKHRDVIIAHLHHFDEILKYVNELSNTIDLIQILSRAEALFQHFQKKVETIDKQYNFPSVPVRQRKPDRTSPETQSQKQKQSSQQLAQVSSPPPCDRQQPSASATGVQNRPGCTSIGDQPPKEPVEAGQVISPLLRKLLSKDFYRIKKDERSINQGPRST